MQKNKVITENIL